MGANFKIQRGVKQGDPVSANLFNAVLEEIFKLLRWYEEGLKIDGLYLNILRFADHVVLISSSLDELRGMGLRIRRNESGERSRNELCKN